jgi:hypothetical protein
MEAGIRTPLLDCFRRGEVAPEVRLLAARGALAPRAHEQIALLVLLVDDPEPEIRRAAEATIGLIPLDPLAAFLARSDVPDSVREFFAARGVQPSASAAPEVDAPLIETDAAAASVEDPDDSKQGTQQRLALMNVVERMQQAMKGNREARAILIRDPNKLVSVSVLSSPKLTETEIEAFAKMANVSEEVLRIIGTTRAWIKNYGVVSALARNPKTPLAISLSVAQRLNEKDLKLLALDRNIQEPLKLAARKRLTSPDRR